MDRIFLLSTSLGSKRSETDNADVFEVKYWVMCDLQKGEQFLFVVQTIYLNNLSISQELGSCNLQCTTFTSFSCLRIEFLPRDVAFHAFPVITTYRLGDRAVPPV